MPAKSKARTNNKPTIPAGIDADFADLYRATVAEVQQNGMTDVDHEMVVSYVISAQSAARWREAERQMLRESLKLSAIDSETAKLQKELYIKAQQAGASAGKSRATANGTARLLKLSPSERGVKASKAISAKGASAGGSLAGDLA